jgi:hypothetical protein
MAAFSQYMARVARLNTQAAGTLPTVMSGARATVPFAKTRASDRRTRFKKSELKLQLD